MGARMESVERLNVTYRRAVLVALWLLLSGTACKQDKPPVAPVVVFGPKSGEVDISYSFSTSTWDPESDSVRYQFDWGDTMGAWTDYVPSGAAVQVSHTWSEHGIHGVRAMAQDKHGKSSEWSSASPDTIFGYPNYVAGTIHVGRSPWGIAALPNSEYVYVACESSDSVYVIRTSDNTVTARIYIPDSPFAVAASPDGDFVYITGYVRGYLYTVRTSDNAIIDTVRLEHGIFSVAPSTDGRHIYVSDPFSDCLVVLRASDDSIEDVTTVGKNPTGIAVLPNGHCLYATSAYPEDAIWEIQLPSNEVVDVVSTRPELGPDNLCSLPDGAFVYTLNTVSNSISVLRTRDDAIVATIPAGGDPTGAVPLPNGHFVLVTNRTSNTVLVIRTADNTVVNTIRVGKSPAGITALPNGEAVYVANQNGTVSVLGYY
jgi:YVTN family beta-propeller protein